MASAKQMELEKFPQRSSEDFVNYSSTGFVEISTEKHRKIELPVEVSETGKYIINFRYSNGSGPWNTDNKAAIRMEGRTICFLNPYATFLKFLGRPSSTESLIKNKFSELSRSKSGVQYPAHLERNKLQNMLQVFPVHRRVKPNKNFK